MQAGIGKCEREELIPMIEAVAVILGLFSASIFLAFAIDAYLLR